MDNFRTDKPTGFEFRWYSKLPVNKQTLIIQDLMKFILQEYMEFIKDSKQKYDFKSYDIYRYTFDEYLQTIRPTVKRSNFYTVFTNFIRNTLLTNHECIEQMYKDIDGLISVMKGNSPSGTRDTRRKC